MLDSLFALLTESWNVFGQMAPYLLFGFLVAGLLSVYISPTWLERHLGGQGMGPVWRASLFGVPLPLCSCSVIPVAVSLRHHGASRGATTAFLLSTPQTGVDSILVTHAMLGPLFAVFRPIAAFLTGLCGGGLVLLAGEPNHGADEAGRKSIAAAGDSRAGTGTSAGTGPGTGPSAGTSAGTNSDTCQEACCSSEHGGGKLARMFRYGFVTLPKDIGPALLVGVLIAGVMAAVVPEDRLAVYLGGGALSILILMSVGVPIYVCATASVPIAAGFMYMGASPGAALAFLIAGPATNAATITTLWKALGPRTALLYLGTVAISALGCGLLLDWLMPIAATAIPQLGSHVHAEPSGGWLSHALAILLLAVLAFSYLWRPASAPRRTEAASLALDGLAAKTGPGERLVLVVQGMSCEHCVESVKRTVIGCDGVRDAEVNLAAGRVLAVGENLDPAPLIAALDKSGFTARVQNRGLTEH